MRGMGRLFQGAMTVRDAQDELSRALATKVQIKGSLAKGRISIEYYTAQQLEELYEFLKKME